MLQVESPPAFAYVDGIVYNVMYRMCASSCGFIVMQLLEVFNKPWDDPIIDTSDKLLVDFNGF
jgi:hypothetical protein